MLFIFAPAKRFPTLWPELLHRCVDNQVDFTEITSDIQEVKIVQLSSNQHMVLASWRVLLNTIHQALEMEGERDTLSDLSQLEGLCEQMDETAFLPLQSEELTSNLSTRLVQFSELVDEVANRLIGSKYASKGGLRASANRYGYIQYLTVHALQISIELNAYNWSKLAYTPFWLGLWYSNKDTFSFLIDKLRPLETSTPPKLFREAKCIYVPLFLKTGVEKFEVVDDVINQIKAVLEIIRE